jgi:hypothetical protein
VQYYFWNVTVHRGFNLGGAVNGCFDGYWTLRRRYLRNQPRLRAATEDGDGEECQNQSTSCRQLTSLMADGQGTQDSYRLPDNEGRHSVLYETIRRHCNNIVETADLRENWNYVPAGRVLGKSSLADRVVNQL